MVRLIALCLAAGFTSAVVIGDASGEVSPNVLGILAVLAVFCVSGAIYSRRCQNHTGEDH